MKNKNGFTLVELLAVLVVLTIILAIAVPGIAGIIKSSTRSSFNSDAKMVLKGIEYKKLENEKFNPQEITKENMMETIGLNSDNYKQVNIAVKDDIIELILVGQNKWEGFTAYGSMKNMRVVESKDYDVVPPSITILGDNPVEVGKGSTYIDAGATATDLKDGDVPISSVVIRNASNVVVESINTSTFTTYTITYTAEDSQGNMATSVRRVNIVDKTAPVITILGDNPTTINVNSIYSDAGATALDETDGDVTSKIVVTGTVNPSILGTYTITYTVKDNASNQAVATRTVNVLDNVIPTVSFSMNGNATYAKSRSTTVTVSDNVAINTSSLKYQWTTSTTAPTEASFSTSFTNGGTINTPAGVTGGYYLWILAKDTSNNTMINRSNVFNLDNTKPVITLNGSSTVTVNKGSTYSDLGATATDAHSGVAGSVTATGTVNTSIVGTYTITYNVNDNAGNAATPVTRTVNVIDVAAPVITILGDNPVSINIGGTYTDAGATALDDVDGDVTSRIVVTGTVNPSVVGTYTITYTVKDNANNQAVATRTVYVVDNIPPTVAFSMNGNTTYAKSRSTTVTVSDNVAVNTSSLKYQWTTSTTAPTEASFSTAFTNGGTISTPAGVTGGYYLWILAKDTSNNIMIKRSNVFNLDNTAPVYSSYTVTNVSTTGYDVYIYGVTDPQSGINRVQFPTWTVANGQDDMPVDWATGATSRGTDQGNGTWYFHVDISLHNNEHGAYITHIYIWDNLENVIGFALPDIQVINPITDFAYIGNAQVYTVPITGKYQLEVWGASGGSSGQGAGAGGYAKGTFALTAGQTLYVYVGGTSPSGTTGGWNGGGNGAGEYAGGSPARGGGGGTDIRLVGTTLNDRIIVAGGGGGAAEYGGGAGGGLYGSNVYDGVGGYGGTPTSGGAGGNGDYPQFGGGGAGSFGQGGGGGKGNQAYAGAGGGGGWYGGGGGKGGERDNAKGGGGGGSGYIRPDATNTQMQTGVRGGNGYAKITYIGQ